MKSHFKNADYISELKNLKIQYDILESQLNSEKALTRSREKFENELYTLKETIEDKKVHAHRLLHYNPKGAQTLFAEIDQAHSAQKELEKNIDAIDAILENFGDQVEEARLEIRAALIHHILSLFPETAADCSRLQNKIEEKTDILNIYVRFANDISTFKKHLERGSHILKKIKKRRFMELFFTRHPKALLAEQIALAEREAELLLNEMRRKKLHSHFQDYHDFLAMFLREVKLPWNHELYKEKFACITRQFFDLNEKLNATLQKKEKEKKEAEKELENWVARHC